MHEDEYKKGVERGYKGDYAPHSLGDEMNLFDTKGARRAREKGYRDGAYARATQPVREEPRTTVRASDYSSSEPDDPEWTEKLYLAVTGICAIIGGSVGLLKGIDFGRDLSAGGETVFGFIGMVIGAIAGVIVGGLIPYALAIGAIILVIGVIALLFGATPPWG